MNKLTLKRERFKAGSLTIEERKNGPNVWAFRWRDGRKRRKEILGTIKELTKSQALKRAEECRQRAPEPESGPQMTISELVQHYVERELEDSGKSAKYVSTCQSVIKLYILPRWGSSSIHGIKALAVEDWLRSLDRANGTKAAVRRVFSTIMRHALRYELVQSNPISQVRQVRKRAVEPEILEPAEIAAVLKELEGVEPVRTAFLIAAVTGLRRGEIFGLQWADVDFDRAILHVRRSYVDGVEGPPKTDSSHRPLPIPLPVVEALQRWKERTSYTRPDSWVFASDFHFGKAPLWPAMLWKRHVAPAIKRAEISKRKLGWHTLRRSYASLLLHAGASVRVSMELMRHSTAEMTLGTYARTVGDEKREAGSRVASIVLGGEQAA